MKLGADGYIATAEEGWDEPHKFSFDLIINCANSSEGFDLARYLSMMDVHGRWVSVGLPEEEGQIIKAQNLISNGVLIGARLVSTPIAYFPAYEVPRRNQIPDCFLIDDKR